MEAIAKEKKCAIIVNSSLSVPEGAAAAVNFHQPTQWTHGRINCCMFAGAQAALHRVLSCPSAGDKNEKCPDAPGLEKPPRIPPLKTVPGGLEITHTSIECELWPRQLSSERARSTVTPSLSFPRGRKTHSPARLFHFVFFSIFLFSLLPFSSFLKNPSLWLFLCPSPPWLRSWGWRLMGADMMVALSSLQS